MPGENKKIDDFSLDFFDKDVDLDNPFASEIKAQKDIPDHVKPDAIKKEKEPDPVPRKEKKEQTGKRSSKDFNPNMEALLITAQSSMIVQAMKHYTQGDFSSSTLPIYLEALSGVSLYIKILDRNPSNYAKLKTFIDVDVECKEVENIAFNLYRKIHNITPENDQEKLAAFEKFELLFKEAVNKALVSNSMKSLKKYLLMSGIVDEAKIKEAISSGSKEFIADINNFIQYVQLAIDMTKKGKCEIAKGLKGRDINIYIIKTSYLLYYYYTSIGNNELSEYYRRMYNNCSKYFVIRD